MTERTYDIYFLIQERAEDIDKREIFPAVPSVATFSFSSDKDTPQGVVETLKKVMRLNAETIRWADFDKSN